MIPEFVGKKSLSVCLSPLLDLGFDVHVAVVEIVIIPVLEAISLSPDFNIWPGEIVQFPH